MFPETFVARACFPNVSQFSHTRNIVSSYNFCFREWLNWETLGKHARATKYVSENMFPRLRESVEHLYGIFR